MKKLVGLMLAASLLAPTAAAAQDDGLIVVTGTRIDRDNYDE